MMYQAFPQRSSSLSSTSMPSASTRDSITENPHHLLQSSQPGQIQHGIPEPALPPNPFRQNGGSSKEKIVPDSSSVRSCPSQAVTTVSSSTVSADRNSLQNSTFQPSSSLSPPSQETNSLKNCSRKSDENKPRKLREKRTIKVRAISSKLADIPEDEYSWLKYGQKPIKGSPTHGGTTSVPATKDVQPGNM